MADRLFALIWGAIVVLFFAALALFALSCVTGCSTGKVEAGATISCLAFSVEPKLKFDGINLGVPIVTNVVCECACELAREPSNSNSPTPNSQLTTSP